MGTVYIDIMRRATGFKTERKVFATYEAAVKWGRKNLDNFHIDMIHFKK